MKKGSKQFVVNMRKIHVGIYGVYVGLKIKEINDPN